MNEITDVRIIRLEPLRVMSTYGFGPSPEMLAWEKMREYAAQVGLTGDGQSHRYFGFNNPSPAPGSPNYGYEQWVTVGPEAQAAGEAKLKEFDGGLYAVAHCRLSHITEVWMALVAWREASPYRGGNHQWLEECLTPVIDHPDISDDEIEFDLYMPIAQ